MAIQGQRFHINLDDGVEDAHPYNGEKLTAGFNVGLVGDIKERVASSDPKPPKPPRFKSSESGFPAHKIRTGSSKFTKKQGNRPEDTNRIGRPHHSESQSSLQHTAGVIPDSNGAGSATNLDLKDPSIDQENKQRLAEMSDQEIEEARQELMTGLSPSLIEKLLKKASIDEGQADSSNELQTAKKSPSERANKPVKKVTFDNPESISSNASDARDEMSSWDPDAPPAQPPPDLHPASSYPSSLPQPPNIHFPNPPQAPDLDASDPDFLSALHSTYFPNLPADPSTMAWMAPLGPEVEEDSSYSPSQDSHPVSALRFDFRGHLLPPRLSTQISSTKGLHHHAHAPSSAGYTVPELSHLARSSYPAQRCIAYQTLGRILYRLGRGDFGQEGEDLCEGLWQLMEQGKVVDQLVEAAAKGDSGNRSIWVIATEAVWLWRKGGGRRWRGR